MQTLISASALMKLKSEGQQPLVVLDCGFDLNKPDAGQAAFLQGHLPGALYAHLDVDLSGAKTGRSGRHPLPTRAAWAQTLGRWGILPGVQVVCYDDQGLPYAARAWWMLQWMGHTDAAVLDGGRAAWLRSGGAWEAGPAESPQPSVPYPMKDPAPMTTVDADAVLAALGQQQMHVIDARNVERYRGDVEPLDPVAGHIPGASQRFFKDNLGTDGCFKPAAELRAEFSHLPLQAGQQVVHQCGSGVTACHNLLAMVHAGLGIGALYPGSWSEWCSDPSRPVAKG